MLLRGACGSDDTGDPGPVDDTGGTPVEVVRLQVIVSVWPLGWSLANARVCWALPEVQTCGLTAEDGKLSLEVVAGSTGRITFEAPSIAPLAMPMVLGGEDVALALTVFAEAYVDERYAQAGVVVDPSRATVAVQVLGPSGPVGGAQVDLRPASGQGPFYLGPHRRWFDLDATSTSDSVGAGWLLNVDPAAGPFEVSATLSSGEICTERALGVAPPAVELTPGFVHLVSLSCP